MITIRTEIEGSRVSIEIRDEGVGIRDIAQARQTLIHVETGTGTIRYGLYHHGKFHG